VEAERPLSPAAPAPSPAKRQNPERDEGHALAPFTIRGYFGFDA
jgi:hypothetical protein